jgi:hypothetical protein
MGKEVITANCKVNINELPNECPFCHKSITPDIIYGYRKTGALDVFFACPDSECKKTFIGEYSVTSISSIYEFTYKVTKGDIKEKSFNQSIIDLSPSFITIYNQANYAEQENLLEICGVGYRKALEFLIKDYAIKNNPTDKENIEKKLLAKCIESYINDDRIKQVSKRAVWLGNDETHYVRKWEGKNLDDMKKLIDLTLHWIEMEILTEEFEREMPD